MQIVEKQVQPDKRGFEPYVPLLAVFFVYSLGFTLVVPTLPKLLHDLAGDAGDASTYYGALTGLKYLLEFIASPVVGALSDSVGRKRVLLLSLSCVAAELLIISLFPNLLFIFLATLVRGLGDHTQTMIYAAAADIAKQEQESVTKSFGYLGGTFGLGCIIGPLIGSRVAAHSLPLCFMLSALMALVALIIVVVFVKETNTSPVPFSRTKANPFINLRIFFANPQLASLSVPFLLSHACTGIYYTWILYMTSTFDASMSEIGVFLSSAGFVLGFMQGVAVPYLVPAVLSDEQAVQLGLLVSCAQMASYGAAPSLKYFYLAMLVFSPASIYGPSLKSLLVKCAGAEQVGQGALQGALSSLRTATAGVGSVLFTLTYSSSMDLAPELKGSPFFLASCLYYLAAAYFKYLQMRGLRSLSSFDEAASSAAPSDSIPGINGDTATTSPDSSSSSSSASVTLPSWSLGLAGLIGVPRSLSGDEEQQSLLTKTPFSSPAPALATKLGGTASQRPRYSSGNLSRSSLA